DDADRVGGACGDEHVALRLRHGDQAAVAAEAVVVGGVVVLVRPVAVQVDDEAGADAGQTFAVDVVLAGQAAGVGERLPRRVDHLGGLDGLPRPRGGDRAPPQQVDAHEVTSPVTTHSSLPRLRSDADEY